MSISSVSAYQQMQSWSATQKQVTDNLIGSLSSSSAADYSSAFTNIAANFYSGSATVTAQSAVSRIQSNIQFAYANGDIPLEFGAQTAKTNGNAILARLGYCTASASPPSSSDPYTAPVNAATGKSYVQTSSANLTNLNAINLFA
jgi:hypothetical protein